MFNLVKEAYLQGGKLCYRKDTKVRSKSEVISQVNRCFMKEDPCPSQTTSTRRRPPPCRASCSTITSASMKDSSMFTRPVRFFFLISWNLMKERYLSKTPFLTFIYLSKCNINLNCIFGNSKKCFL